MLDGAPHQLRMSPLSALSSDEHQFRVPAGPKPLEEQKGHMDCFFSSKLGLPDSNPGGCTDDWRMPGPDILNRLARKSLKLGRVRSGRFSVCLRRPSSRTLRFLLRLIQLP